MEAAEATTAPVTPGLNSSRPACEAVALDAQTADQTLGLLDPPRDMCVLHMRAKGRTADVNKIGMSSTNPPKQRISDQEQVSRGRRASYQRLASLPPDQNRYKASVVLENAEIKRVYAMCRKHAERLPLLSSLGPRFTPG